MIRAIKFIAHTVFAAHMPDEEHINVIYSVSRKYS